jgi:hypothetical protein
MKKLLYIFLALVIISTVIEQCGKAVDWAKHSYSSGSSTSSPQPTHVINRVIKTAFGDLPNGGRYMDEYYLDESGNKVWHGFRKNIYPSGQIRMEEKYEDGVSLWYVKYDEMGQIIEDTRK